MLLIEWMQMLRMQQKKIRLIVSVLVRARLLKDTEREEGMVEELQETIRKAERNKGPGYDEVKIFNGNYEWTDPGK